ncbi:hypothetical protein BRADI_1g21308v3 [Brachypodium distachyon]|uniref:Uncharacterized protein n=1 Tax=Brachypodium distachyon TaxID=15368 RepID=A0A2K2DKD1_BRADI|nr:hypothetical protein BRADI_1g21308v3 [Brachypodium distachyon]
MELQSTAKKPIRCKAAVSKVAGQPLEMVEVDVAPPRAHEVRIRILCTSLCHTDVTFWRMKVLIVIRKICCAHVRALAGLRDALDGIAH